MNHLAILTLIALSFGIGVIFGWLKGRDGKPMIELPEEPRVIVNLPKDGASFAQMDGDRVIVGEEAVVWVEVYKEALRMGRGSWATDDANEAIETCFSDR